MTIRKTGTAQPILNENGEKLSKKSSVQWTNEDAEELAEENQK